MSKQLEYVKSLYNKLVVGLDYIKKYFLPQPVTITLLPASDSATLVEFFPSNIKEDFQSGLKWRTIQTLIEIAYQNPSDTNPKKLAKNLNFPFSSISSEIKKLITLNYIETFISAQVMRDGRYRNYTITHKVY